MGRSYLPLLSTATAACSALGSGIFSPRGPLNYTYSAGAGSRLVTARVPVIRRGEEGAGQLELEQEAVQRTQLDQKGAWARSWAYSEDMTSYSQAEMARGRPHTLRLCHHGAFCCEASYHIRDLGPSEARCRSSSHVWGAGGWVWQVPAGGLLRVPRHDDGAADGHAGVRRGHLHPHPRHCGV